MGHTFLIQLFCTIWMFPREREDYKRKLARQGLPHIGIPVRISDEKQRRYSCLYGDRKYHGKGGPEDPDRSSPQMPFRA